MANSTRNRAPEPKIGGASGDTRNVSSNLGGQKADKDIESASSSGAGTSTGSEAGDQVMDEKLQLSKGKRAA